MKPMEGTLWFLTRFCCKDLFLEKKMLWKQPIIFFGPSKGQKIDVFFKKANHSTHPPQTKRLDESTICTAWPANERVQNRPRKKKSDTLFFRRVCPIGKGRFPLLCQITRE